MSATKGDGSLHDLTRSQGEAVNALIAGGTHEDAALAAGVHRVTVTRWVNHHPAFIAEVNRVRADLANRTQAKIVRVTDLALEVVQTALEAGDLETALKVASPRSALPADGCCGSDRVCGCRGRCPIWDAFRAGRLDSLWRRADHCGD